MEKIKVTNKRILLAVLLVFIGLGFLSGCVAVDRTASTAVCRWYGTELGSYPYWIGVAIAAVGIVILLAGTILLFILMQNRRVSNH